MKAALWKLQIISIQDILYISGIVIKGNPKIQHEEDRSLSTFKKVILSYFIRPLKHHTILILHDGKYTTATSNKNGEFEARIRSSSSQEIQVLLEKDGLQLPVLQDYPVHFKGLEKSSLVISDIDDTILQSHGWSSLKKMRSILFRSPIKRKRIDATHRAFESFHKSHFDFIYISRSEYNLFNLITTFIKEQDFPLGPIFLRRFAGWKKLLDQKGKKEFKYGVIDELFKQFPDHKVVFFGDDSQYDLDIYTHFEELFPNNILKIFIHRTRGKVRDKEIEWNLEAQNMLDKVCFYDSFEQIESTLKEINNEIILRP
jgi:phosphatidate phosphatase APP1